MKKKLITWEAFEETFRPDSDRWNVYVNGYVEIIYHDMYWFIYPEGKKLFGTEVEVEIKKFNGNDYTHENLDWYFHESWFEPEYQPIEFIKEEEMML